MVGTRRVELRRRKRQEAPEAAHHARLQPRVSDALRRRQEGFPDEVISISWRCQQPLHHKCRHLGGRLGRNRAITAVAQQLVEGLAPEVTEVTQRHVAQWQMCQEVTAARPAAPLRLPRQATAAARRHDPGLRTARPSCARPRRSSRRQA